ncbi:hypothetical protein MMC20_001860 [Loxospora ochrophaea]|nr:hypothetical protein [Loxospora ochrophaea]
MSGPLPRISREQLCSLLLATTGRDSGSSASPPSSPTFPLSSLAVIDVRDQDHVGGHIHSSLHIPSSTFDYRCPELVWELRERQIVIFHCALSQQRGPCAAERYLGERRRLLKGDDDDGWGGQRVYVLEGGFVSWQEK